ncbi:MAG: NAD(P)-dependent oxidoreductase [Burkholderiaceae bacterium]
MAKILLTHPHDAFVTYYGEKALAGLQSAAQVQRNTTGKELNNSELIEAAKDCQIIVSYRQTPGEGELFRNLPGLVAFCRCAVDIRNVDVAAASAEGILITHAGPGFMASVSEWVIGAMIDLSRQITASAQTFHAGGAPIPAMGRELRGATLGVIGYGRISRYLCKLGLALGMKIVVSDPYAEINDPAITALELPSLLKQADYVVCLAVANEDTENLMNARTFGYMKPTAFFINPSRGNLVDEAALRQALDMGQIAGCAMDVGRAPDQMPTPALARHEKVIATPHLGGLTPPAIEFQALETVAQVAEILMGKAPKGAVNAEHATRLARLRP